MLNSCLNTLLWHTTHYAANALAASVSILNQAFYSTPVARLIPSTGAPEVAQHISLHIHEALMHCNEPKQIHVGPMPPLTFWSEVSRLSGQRYQVWAGRKNNTTLMHSCKNMTILKWVFSVAEQHAFPPLFRSRFERMGMSNGKWLIKTLHMWNFVISHKSPAWSRKELSTAVCKLHLNWKTLTKMQVILLDINHRTLQKEQQGQEPTQHNSQKVTRRAWRKNNSKNTAKHFHQWHPFCTWLIKNCGFQVSSLWFFQPPRWALWHCGSAYPVMLLLEQSDGVVGLLQLSTGLLALLFDRSQLPLDQVVLLRLLGSRHLPLLGHGKEGGGDGWRGMGNQGVGEESYQVCVCVCV